ncbi:Stem-specific protein TSJT1 [Hibiscus syriacus]|uniref:Stem-specific protein TSJT1 n=1 Tax=Hibiscus syriacus TaxID=106335 RepID=A0A6A3BIT2_HIBSY|nr:stem-specific protein TSJT1-like [Hibiscus syriacus]KAE8716936.1 Stem-specific protein TSJT1 [Hibiscus syriacus]
MLAVFEKAIGNPPEELQLPSVGLDCKKTREEISEMLRLLWPKSTFYHLSNGNLMTLSHEAQSPLHQRSMFVTDDIFCIFMGTLVNICELRRHYGSSRQATEAMLLVDAYKALRDRAPYPPDQVIKDLQGKFAFILFDAKSSTLFVARDGEGSVELKWGMAGDGSLVLSDDPDTIQMTCGKSSASFPPGCIFTNGNGLVSIDHPLHKVKAIAREDEDGNICGVMFQVDLFTRLPSIPRTGSAANWADVAAAAEAD